MSIRVLYFARSREITRRTEEELTIDDMHAGASVAADGSALIRASAPVALSLLLPHLVRRYPDLASLPSSSLLALNEELVDEAEMQTTYLKPGDVVALIQPISGG
jgi:molybdopterin converting factor small subunit